MLAMAFAFTSCGSDDDDDPKDTNLYGLANVMIQESVFEIATATLVLEYDGQQHSFKFDESTKVANESHIAALTGNGAARVIEKQFVFKADPAKAYIKFELTAAGKKKLTDDPNGRTDFQFIYGFGKVKPGETSVSVQNGGAGKVLNSKLEGLMQEESDLARTIK